MHTLYSFINSAKHFSIKSSTNKNRQRKPLKINSDTSAQNTYEYICIYVCIFNDIVFFDIAEFVFASRRVLLRC